MIFVKSDHIFTDYAHAKQRGDTKEAERLGKAIDDNAKLANQYLREIHVAYALAPDLPKLSFMEWLKFKGITVIEEKPSLSFAVAGTETVETVKQRINMTRRSKKTGRYIHSRRSSSRVHRTRKRGLSAKKLRAIKTYASKGYSANRIQKRMRQRHMGVRRKTILRVVRETKGRPPRANPEKYVRRKYRRPTAIRYPSLLPEQVMLVGYHDGEKVKKKRLGSGRELYEFVKEEMSSEYWDSKPNVVS
jgi:hypothetical protein